MRCLQPWSKEGPRARSVVIFCAVLAISDKSTSTAVHHQSRDAAP